MRLVIVSTMPVFYSHQRLVHQIRQPQGERKVKTRGLLRIHIGNIIRHEGPTSVSVAYADCRILENENGVLYVLSLETILYTSRWKVARTKNHLTRLGRCFAAPEPYENNVVSLVAATVRWLTHVDHRRHCTRLAVDSISRLPQMILKKSIMRYCGGLRDKLSGLLTAPNAPRTEGNRTDHRCPAVLLPSQRRVHPWLLSHNTAPPSHDIYLSDCA